MNLLGHKLKSVIKNVCPKCHKGKFFEKQLFLFRFQFDKMNKSCSHCNESFEKETGFYFGAMYVSYGLTVFFGIVSYLLLVQLFELSVLGFISAYSISLLLFLPAFFQLSRLIWINIFVHPNENLSKK